MEMLNDWMRMKMVESDATTIALPAGYEKDAQGEDTFFEILDVGPTVTLVGAGDVVACSFMQGMFRYKLPTDSFKSYALRESELIGVVKRGGPHAGD